MRHRKISNQQDYLPPHLINMIHTITNEAFTTSSILNKVMGENEIPYT